LNLAKRRRAEARARNGEAAENTVCGLLSELRSNASGNALGKQIRYNGASPKIWGQGHESKNA
jgi:hypothetical protein